MSATYTLLPAVLTRHVLFPGELPEQAGSFSDGRRHRGRAGSIMKLSLVTDKSCPFLQWDCSQASCTTC